MRFDDRALAPYQGKEPYIFLSYSHLDGEHAAELIRGMNENGFRVWYDEGLVPGKEWDENIARTIMHCSYFVALMSKNYLESANCRDELNFARDKKLPLLLIYLENIELPAGMEMRLGRMLAIHKDKYPSKEQLFAKIRTADGISVCRDIPEGEEPEEPFVPEEAEVEIYREKPRRSAAKIVIPAVAALLILAAVFLLPKGKKTAAPAETPIPAATELPAPTESQPAAATPAPVETDAPAPVETEAPQNMEQEQAYQAAAALRDAGRTAPAALAFYKLGDYKDAAQQSKELWDSCIRQSTISSSVESTLGLKEDGTVYYTGKWTKEKSNVQEWGNIVAVAAGAEHSLGLTADGTVVSKGVNKHGERSLSGWKDIVSIVAGKEISMGICADGTVIARGNNVTGRCDVDQWTEIVAVDAGEQHTVGLRRDGTVESAGYNSSKQRDVEEWTDIVAIAAGYYFTVGVKADGTVLATGYNATGQCDVEDWTDIVAVAAGKRHTVGLKADGTVVATGHNSLGECNVSDWTNVVEIACGEATTIALTADGKVLSTGDNEFGQCNVERWTDMRIPFWVQEAER